MDPMCSRNSVLDDLENGGEVSFSDLSLRHSPSHNVTNNPIQKMHCISEEGSFTSSNDNNSFSGMNDIAFHSNNELPNEVKEAGKSPTTMEKISMILGAHFPEDSKLLANPKGIIKSYLSIAAANDPDKFDSYRKLCMAHVNEYYRHLKGDTGALCLVCNVPCQHWNTLQRHLQTHINFRPFSCDLCNRTFYSQSKLKRHQVIHNDIKPYKCPVCERRLGRPEHLKRHLLVHTDSKPFGCSGCSHTTKRLDGIRRHIKRKHGAEGAKIVEIEIPFDAQILSNAQQAISSVDDSLSVSIKTKKKKKKKKINSTLSQMTPAANTSGCQSLSLTNESRGSAVSIGSKQMSNEAERNNQQNKEETDAGGVLDVAASFGVRDLRIFANDDPSSMFLSDQSKNAKQRFQSCSQKLSHSTNDKPACRLLVTPHPMHLLYQKLTRPASTNGDQQQGGSSPIRSSSDSQVFPPEHNNLPQSDIFPNNGSESQIPPDQQQRFLPSSGNGGVTTHSSTRHINSMLLSSPTMNTALGHYPHPPDLSSLPAEMMISQYFQSHQRFAPPVWGFANPNYPNY